MPDTPNVQLSKAGSPAGTTVTHRQDFTGEEITIGQDLSPAAAAAEVKAEVEARILAARRWPRDIEVFRQGLLTDCKRPGFADIALYQKPVGRKKNAQGEWEDAFAVNFSIRFIESALQHLGNVHIASRINYEDEHRARLTVTVMDVQRIIDYSTDVMLDKVVERKEVKQGRTVRGMRENSYGDKIYLVEATRDEFRNVMGAERSKLIRDNGQRLLPRDILDEARALVDATIADANAKDPDSAKKKVLDKFLSLGVGAAALKEYLGRPLETLTLKDLNELAALYNGLKEGDFTWADVMRVKNEPAEGEEKRATTAREKIKAQPSFAKDAKPPEEPKP